MNPIRPPRIATWLLNHFGCSPRNDELLGDLAEQYGRGYSRAWYWRQVSVAIAMGLVNECLDHKWLTARALLIGWTLLLFFPSSFNFLLRDLLFGLESWSRWWRQAWILPLTWTLYLSVLCMISGWLVARFHRPHQVSMVLVFALSYCCVFWPMSFSSIADGVRWWWPIYVTPIAAPTSILLGGGVLTRSARMLPNTDQSLC